MLLISWFHKELAPRCVPYIFIPGEKRGGKQHFSQDKRRPKYHRIPDVYALIFLLRTLIWVEMRVLCKHRRQRAHAFGRGRRNRPA